MHGGEYINGLGYRDVPSVSFGSLKWITTFDRAMSERQRVRATGHENVTAEHASTLEFTSDDWLTPAGDCILGVEAVPVPAAFADGFVEACQSTDATITATIRAAGSRQRIKGRGDPELTFEDDRSMVVRTSEYVDDRTVMVGADTAAAGIDRDIVDALARGESLECVFEVER